MRIDVRGRLGTTVSDSTGAARVAESVSGAPGRVSVGLWGGDGSVVAGATVHCMKVHGPLLWH